MEPEKIQPPDTSEGSKRSRSEDAPSRRLPDPRLVLSVAGCLLFLAILADVVADGFLASTVDPAVSDALRLDEGTARQAVAVLTGLGDVVFLAPMGLLALILLLRRQRLARASITAVAAGTGLGIVYATKFLVARQRPDLSEHLTSFPSGHAANTIIVWGLVLFVAVSWPPRDSQPTSGRWWADTRPAALTALIGGVMGVTRLLLGVHWTTDVVAGWAFGAAWLAVSLYVIDRAELRWGTRFERLRAS